MRLAKGEFFPVAYFVVGGLGVGVGVAAGCTAARLLQISRCSSGVGNGINHVTN